MAELDLISILDYREKEIIDVFLMVDARVLVGVVDTYTAPHQVTVDNLTNIETLEELSSYQEPRYPPQ